MSWPLRTLGTAAAPLPTWGGIPRRDATANSIPLPQAKSTRPRRRGLGAETRPRPLAAAGSGVPRSDPTPSGGARAPAASDRARWGREPRSPRRGGGSRAGERGGWGANGERTSPAAATGSSVPPPPSAVGAVVARRLGRRLRKLGSFFVFSFFPRRISLRLWVVGLLNTTRFLFFFLSFLYHNINPAAEKASALATVNQTRRACAAGGARPTPPPPSAGVTASSRRRSRRASWRRREGAAAPLLPSRATCSSRAVGAVPRCLLPSVSAHAPGSGLDIPIPSSEK